MLKTLILILTVSNAGGEDSTFVIDHSLTNIDCIELALEWSYTLDEFSYITCELEISAPAFSD
jgi:hypothetical protein